VIATLLRHLTRLHSMLWIWLLGASAMVIWGIDTLVRGLSLVPLIVVTLGGLSLGWGLARIRAPWWLATLVFAGAGLEVVLLIIGRLWPLSVGLLGTGGRYLVALWWSGPRNLPDPAPLWLAAQRLATGGGVVTARLLAWVMSLSQSANPDPLPVQLVWGWALWLAAALAAYLVWRDRQALLAVAPLGTLLAITIFFTNDAYTQLGIFLCLALALQAAAGWRRREQRWQTAGFDYATDLVLDLAMVTVPLIVLVVGLSLVTPQLSLARLAARFRQHMFPDGQQIGNVANAFGLEARSAGLRLPLPGGLPRSHLLGSGPELGEQLVLTIRTDDPTPASPLDAGGEPPPAYYWLAAAYDVYTGHGWASSPLATVDLAPEEAQLSPEGPGRAVVQTVTRHQSYANLLFSAGFPLRVDQPAQISFRSQRDWVGTILGEVDTYVASSWLLQTSPLELDQAGTDYPDWIRKRYLNLPESLPERVSELALQLTATASTPYDRALALETYLRAIPYSLDVPGPPYNRDVADFFLFDLQTGYCDYYATSMTVLARAAGLPARFVIGYAPSPYDHETGQYVVRESEAHSWTQIYFPEYGWIDFEPTAGRAALARGAGEAAPSTPPLPGPSTAASAAAVAGVTLPHLAWWSVALVLLGGLALAGGLGAWGMDRRLNRLPVERLLPHLKGRLELGAHLLDLPLPAGLTPLEFRSALLDELARIAAARPVLRHLAPSPSDISQLIAAFVILRYAKRPAPASRTPTIDAAVCLAAWHRVRGRLWALIIINRLWDRGRKISPPNLNEP
jgi:hypothetical protein